MLEKTPDMSLGLLNSLFSSPSTKKRPTALLVVRHPLYWHVPLKVSGPPLNHLKCLTSGGKSCAVSPLQVS